MYQLNYHSKSKLGLELEDLDNILAKANTINSEKAITGCLIYHNSSFVQILEGNKIDVLRVFEKIKSDQRHHTITLLWENNIEDRLFSEWNMAYHRPNSESIKEYINNLLLLSMLSDKSKASLLSFWTSVRRILSDS
ncbi:BLUF domain-containing protein [Winogradskyella costae]|uniref:BLUF domain-containing protein n=1 Tax=Winogradskyella costae TaxID=2697008 RepID=UPI0015CD0768|nr:BLUF domain-containing protein [Winogradskyella costae]